MYNAYPIVKSVLILNKYPVYTFEHLPINKNAPYFSGHFLKDFYAFLSGENKAFNGSFLTITDT